jgi:hypothetical protein
MKTKILLGLAVICALAVQPVSAQMARYYNLFNQTEDAENDLTATLSAATTNQVVLAGVTNQFGSPTSATAITSSNIVLYCYDFNTAGFTFKSVGVAGSTNGTFGVQIFGSSSRGAVWDSSARWNFTTTNAAPGSQTYTVVTNLDLTGLDRIAFVFLNGSANGYQTNVVAGVRLKATRVLTMHDQD